MDEGAEEELQRLRARAYGPSADIQADPRALRRLDELESLRMAGDAPPAAVGDAPPAAAGEDGDVDVAPSTRSDTDRTGTEAASVDPEVPDLSPAHAGPAGPAERRRRIGGWWVTAIWAASLVAVALIAGAAALAAAPPAPLLEGARHIATLQEAPGFEWPSFFGEEPPDARAYEDFYGMTPVSATSMFMSGITDACLILVPTAEIVPNATSFDNRTLPGCGAGPFPSTVQIVVRGELPPELLLQFPEGTALQFVLDGVRVHVYSADPE